MKLRMTMKEQDLADVFFQFHVHNCQTKIR